MFHFVDWLPTIISAAIDKSVLIEEIDGVNQWYQITNNLKSKRTSFIYSIDPYGQRHIRDLCGNATEAIRYL